MKTYTMRIKQDGTIKLQYFAPYPCSCGCGELHVSWVGAATFNTVLEAQRSAARSGFTREEDLETAGEATS